MSDEPTNAGPRNSALGIAQYMVSEYGAETMTCISQNIPNVGEWVCTGLVEWGETAGVTVRAVLHDVERLGCRIEHGCEGLADAAGLRAKEADQRQKAADDQVAEQHVEQQLTVVPACAVGAAA